MKYILIYKTTNIINNMEYIGKRVTEDINDSYLGSGKHLKRAIKKYGIENFIKNILFVFDNEEDMNNKEKELVTDQYCSRNDTYNICEGGKGGFSYINKNNLGNTIELRNRKSQKMKSYWIDELKNKKSLDMKFYNELHGVDRYKDNLKKRYDDLDYLEKFSKKMNMVNKSSTKRKKAGETIKHLWQDENFRNKTIEARLGIVWWTDGENTLKSKESPGDGWVRGRSNKGLGRKNETH